MSMKYSQEERDRRGKLLCLASFFIAHAYTWGNVSCFRLQLVYVNGYTQEKDGRKRTGEGRGGEGRD